MTSLRTLLFSFTRGTKKSVSAVLVLFLLIEALALPISEKEQRRSLTLYDI